MTKRTFLAGKTFDLTARQRQLWELNGKHPIYIKFPHKITHDNFEYYLIYTNDKVLNSDYSYDYLHKILVGQEIISSKNERKSYMGLSAFVKKLMDKDLSAMHKLGYISSDLTLTEKGTDWLLAELFLANKQALGEAARTELADKNKSKKCKKSEDCEVDED